MDLKRMVEKAEKYDNYVEFFQEREKHTKGYIYDSLCYRYQLARYKAMEMDINTFAIDLELKEAEKKAKSLYERDCMRFYQILDEAIGDHE